MKKGLLLFACLFVAFSLTPGGVASWGEDLFIKGIVTTVVFTEELAQGEQSTISAEKTHGEGEDIADETDTEPGNDHTVDESEYKIKPEPLVKEYLLIITTIGKGKATPMQGLHSYEQGREVKITATPEEGWLFDKWIIDESQYSSSDIVIIIKSDISAEAIFMEADGDLEGEEEMEWGKEFNDSFKNEENGSEVSPNKEDKEEPSANSREQNGADH